MKLSAKKFQKPYQIRSKPNNRSLRDRSFSLQSNAPLEVNPKRQRIRFQCGVFMRSIGLVAMIVMAATGSPFAAAQPPSTKVAAGQSSVTQQSEHARQVNIATITGATVSEIVPGRITFQQPGRPPFSCKIQTTQQQGVTIGGAVFDAPAAASIQGRLPIRLAEKGMLLKCSARLNLNGEIEEPVLEFEHLAKQVLQVPSQPQPHVEFFERPETNADFADCEIVGRVIAVNRDVVSVAVPKAKWARRSKINIPVNDNSLFRIRQTHLKNLRPGDHVNFLEVRQFDNGQRLIKTIDATFSPVRSRLTIRINDRLEQEFAHLSTVPQSPRALRSDHFVLHTDASQQQAMVLLAKLENMFSLVANYYARRPSAPIQCYVVDDLARWDRRQLPPAAIAKIAQRSGVTIITNASPQKSATVYSCHDHRIVQHESVHAFCVHAFGGLGPVWYAEGMAELGLYFDADSRGVQIDPVVVEFLRSTPPKTVAQIIADVQTTGDSWQQYAWRWAVCHFLSFNQNFRRRFKKLGTRLMADHNLATEDPTGNALFDRTFLRQRERLDFEFAHFIDRLDNGVDASAMRIHWDLTPRPISRQDVVARSIKPTRGWQVVGVAVESGQRFQIATRGQWQASIDSDFATAAMQVCVLQQTEDGYKMTQVQSFVDKCNYVAPAGGQLLFRCDEAFDLLHDNAGAVEVFVRIASK